MYQESLQVQNEHVIILIHAHIIHQRGSCRKQSTTKTAFSLFDYLYSLRRLLPFMTSCDWKLEYTSFVKESTLHHRG